MILSGGPASTTEIGSPRAPQIVFEAGVPVLGICYGQMTMCVQLGGEAESSDHREFGRAFVEIEKECPLFEGLWATGQRHQVWMSHGDRVISLPEGFEVFGRSEGAPFAIFGDAGAARCTASCSTPRWCTRRTAPGCSPTSSTTSPASKGDWTMAAYSEQAVAAIREQVGNGRVICGLSGGVDSSVAAVLIHEAIGDQLTCIFVDHGLMRKNEAAEVVAMFRGHYNIPLVHVDAADRFIGALEGEADPEKKRKTIGRLFIEVFEEEAKKIGGAEFLAQGTLYPDVIESVSFTGGPSVTIKSHHNVGGLPARMNMKLVEPLRELFKDEVRALGTRARPARAVHRPPSVPRAGPRHPLPGRHHPRKARHTARGRRDLSRRDPQGRPLRRDLAGLRRAAAGADGRRHGRRPHLRIRLRAARRHLGRRHDRRLLPLRHGLPRRAATRIINEVRGINRVVYDVTSQAARHDRVGVIWVLRSLSRTTEIHSKQLI